MVKRPCPCSRTTWLSNRAAVAPVVAIELAVLHRDDAAVERREDRDADVHLAEAADVRVGSGVTVVGLRSAGEVAQSRAGIEVDEVVRVEVAPEDPCLRIEGELSRSVRASRAGCRHGDHEREQQRDGEAAGHEARHRSQGQRTATGVPTSTNR